MDRSLPEIRYSLGTLFGTAGFPIDLRWYDQAHRPDVYYGPRSEVEATVVIPAVPWEYASVAHRVPQCVSEGKGIPQLIFEGGPAAETHRNDKSLRLGSDVIFASYWLLTGPEEPLFPRDRWDNLDVRYGSMTHLGLLSRPLVSLQARALRSLLDPKNRWAIEWPWESSGHACAGALTHDVDYPEIIRWLEAGRLIARPNVGNLRLALEVTRGNSHFWKFQEWIDFAGRFGARPAFYFMAHPGSIGKYVIGTPDAFYDIRHQRFHELFVQLEDLGCEIGLHASFHAHRSTDALREERSRLENACGRAVPGNRHHYWHLNPDHPAETLRRLAAAGLTYDSSLMFETHPGFRRGICHPFHPFDADTRTPIDIVQIPPTWMDDHFDRRLAINGIQDPDAAAERLVGAVEDTGGIMVLDYHVRGMNKDFFPRYGEWLGRFAERRLGTGIEFLTPNEIVRAFEERERKLAHSSIDRTVGSGTVDSVPPTELKIEPVDAASIEAVVRLHHETFGDPKRHGHSVATLGPGFLADVFYRLNLDNPHFRCDVAWAGDSVVGFSVYSTDKNRGFGHLIRRHFFGTLAATLKHLARNPSSLRAFAANAVYLRGERLDFLTDVQGWWIVAAIVPGYRSGQGKARVGARVLPALIEGMEVRMRVRGCSSWYGVVDPTNIAINKVLERLGAIPVDRAKAQGLRMLYYVKRLDAEPAN